ncbi:MAG: glycosyltransferase [Chitinophagaceae bacterium]|jgi:glycosyltransferase involved in cell wall biosynthesis|nr:MAG: glycosyltransferase [Chitinophagaceae bacterium]
MKINIASYGGRNWLLDTARELEKLGHEVRFYSYFPTKRAVKYDLKRESSYSYFLLAAPFLLLLKVTRRAHWALFLYHYFFDHYTAWIMKPCDVFIGQSPMHVYSLKKARKKFKSKIIVERGTRHVLEQIQALKLNPALKGKNPMPDMFLKRDLQGYELADYITVPSQIVRESFLLHGIKNEKLFVNPFGVSLEQFSATALNRDNAYDLIMVGQWCHRKGCDLIVEVCKKYNFSLLHVGSIVDLPFPTGDQFTHVDAVQQTELMKYYSRARVFVLPSREEGLALVQPQALICGLPIVCSRFTGGRDLIQFLEDPKWIIEMKELAVEDLAVSIQKGLELSFSQQGLRSYSKGIETYLTWEAYGKRYNDFLLSVTNQ